MPAKVNQKKPQVGGDWKGYVNWNPTTAERDKVLAFMGHKDWSAEGEITTLAECGYSVSFNAESDGNAYRVAVTGKTNPCPNIGYTLSVRASSVERLLGLVGYYCHVICSDGDWLVEKRGSDVW